MLCGTHTESMHAWDDNDGVERSLNMSSRCVDACVGAGRVKRGKAVHGVYLQKMCHRMDALAHIVKMRAQGWHVKN